MISISICYSQSISGNGKITKQEHPVTPFNAINVNDGWDLVLEQTDNYSILVETDDNLHNVLIMEVKNDTLNIHSTKRIKKHKKKLIYINFKELNGIIAHGGSDIYSKGTIKTDIFSLIMNNGNDVHKLKIDANCFIGNFDGTGAELVLERAVDIKVKGNDGDLSLSNITAKNCEIIQERGSVVIDGKTKHLQINACKSDLNIKNLLAEHGKIYLDACKDIPMLITNSLDITLKNRSNVICYECPKTLNKTVDGTSEFAIRD